MYIWHFEYILFQDLMYCLLCLDFSDEVGFIHPSQFAMLIEETSYSIPSSCSNLWQSADDIASFKRSNVDTSDNHVIRHFWNRDHKLGISSAILLPLYKVAKCAFMDAIRQYKVLRNPSDEFVVENSPCTLSSSDSVESDVLKHSRALILISCDFGTAWHSRFSPFSCLVLSYTIIFY